LSIIGPPTYDCSMFIMLEMETADPGA
jgi:hypothetical protein